MATANDNTLLVLYIQPDKFFHHQKQSTVYLKGDNFFQRSKCFKPSNYSKCVQIFEPIPRMKEKILKSPTTQTK